MNEEYQYEIDKYIIGVDKGNSDEIGLTVGYLENEEFYIIGSCYGEQARFIDLLIKQNTELKDNWNKLKEWLEEEFKANENWYNSDLTPHDKGYYREEYVTIKHNIKLVQRIMQKIEGGMNESNKSAI